MLLNPTLRTVAMPTVLHRPERLGFLVSPLA